MPPKSAEYYIKGILEKNKRILSKAITLIESARKDHRETSRVMVDKLLPHSGKAVRLGITGVPGVGKSTFIESLGMFLIDNGLSVCVLAVDPSSQKSGGSILADKTRMEKLCVAEKAFIRPFPNGQTLGGVTGKTRETMIACEAFGFDVVIVETVGVGQSETKVASMVDFYLVLMLAGAGDELQGIKKGILEIADAIVVNKADGDNMENAMKARKTYENALHMLLPSSSAWHPPVMTCSGLTSLGISEIWNAVLDHRKKLSDTGTLWANRRKQNLDWMWGLVEEELKYRFFQDETVKKKLPGIILSVEQGKMAPTKAAYELMELNKD